MKKRKIGKGKNSCIYKVKNIQTKNISQLKK